MNISRRDFLKVVSASAAILGLSALELENLEKALANPDGPTVIWLQGSCCTGCSVSFLNRFSTDGPQTAADVLINAINLTFHPNLMALAGQSAVDQIQQTYKAGNYILAIEGGVPTAFNGAACWAWSYNGTDVTLQDAVTGLASRAAQIICVGTCASWGGVAAAPPNPTGVKSIRALTGRSTINVAGCPTHPDWLVWVVVQMLLGNTITLDTYGRPSALFRRTVHDQCPLRETEEAKTFGVERHCLKELGCRGPESQANCPNQWFNGGRNWCIGAGAPCNGCVMPTFPGTSAFYKIEGSDSSESYGETTTRSTTTVTDRSGSGESDDSGDSETRRRGNWDSYRSDN